MESYLREKNLLTTKNSNYLIDKNVKSMSMKECILLPSNVTRMLNEVQISWNGYQSMKQICGIKEEYTKNCIRKPIVNFSFFKLYQSEVEAQGARLKSRSDPTNIGQISSIASKFGNNVTTNWAFIVDLYQLFIVHWGSK